MAITLLDKPLGDLRREIADLRQISTRRDYDIGKLTKLITISNDSLRETQSYQKTLLQQLQEFEFSLADINEILRANLKQKLELKQQKQQPPLDNDVEISAKLMALNAEALECRAAAVQLQQDAKMALIKASEIEKRANDELAQQEQEKKLKQQEIERERAAELERRVKLEEERQRLKELQIQQQKERRLALEKTQQEPQCDEYTNWHERDFMNNDRYPPCIFRLAPNATSMPIDIKILTVSETENLLDEQEELISTPMDIKFDSAEHQQQGVLIAIPYVTKRSTHRENVIKIRNSNGIWLFVHTTEVTFDSHKDRRFVECKLEEPVACAVVSRLKRDTILIDKKSSGRFLSNADPRVSMEWPANVCATSMNINLRVVPVDLSTFTQFVKNFSSDTQGLIAVGPIIELYYDNVALLKPIKFTMPMIVHTKKPAVVLKPVASEQEKPDEETINQISQQEMFLKQQESIFRAVLGEDSSNERLVLLYSSHNDNIWHADTNLRLFDTKTNDIITTNMEHLYSRMIIARYDKKFISAKQLQPTISLLEESLSFRTVSLILRRRFSNPNEICFVCCSSQRINNVDRDLQEEDFLDPDEQHKEIILHEGQILELRFRGNVLPNEYNQQSYQFAYNKNFPFYYQTNVSEIDKYSQHLSPFFYGFVQIFSRKITKDYGKKKQQSDTAKQDSQEQPICLAELVIRIPKPHETSRVSTPKALATFPPEGILTPLIFHEIAASLTGNEWRRLARRLGMSKIRIEAIGQEYKDDPGYYMLLTWFKRAPHSVDKDLLLINALTSIKRWDIGQELEFMKEAKRQEKRTSSIDEQSRIFNVAFTRICQHGECIRLWKQIAQELTLTCEDIQQIEEQYKLKQERCLRSLELWASNDSRADIKTLARIMRALGFRSLSRELTSMI